MHTFQATEDGTFKIIFDHPDSYRTLFEVTSLGDACCAVSALNGGMGTFAVIEKRESERIILTRSIAVPGY